MVPASQFAKEIKEIKTLQRILGKKTVENEILREAVGVQPLRKLDYALAIAAGGRPLKRVCEVLGVAHSGATARRARPVNWRDARSARRMDDAGLVTEQRHD